MAARSGFFLRWLRGAWPGWLALVLLLVGMSQVVEPRVGLFMDYWYGLPESAAAESRAQADSLRQSREQVVLQRAWLVGAAPVALLFLLQLLQMLFSRHDDEAVDGNDDGAVAAGTVEYRTADPALSHAEKALVREAELTLVRQVANQPAAANPAAAKPADVTQVRASNGADVTQLRPAAAVLLDDDGALHIGPGKRYRVERLLASGGMGSVHKGYDTVLQREVALKELDVNLAQDQEQSDRFRQEARALAGLAHPYIVPVYDLVEDDNRFWIVMELLPGGDLDQRIEKNRPNARTATNIIRAIAEGLAFAHNKGIVHRDIKPMNILFNSDGIPKLVDFGIAKLVQSQQSVVQTREGLSLGSPTYMSPEQAAGKKDIDKRTDIYALGITFYKTLTGEVPFTGEVAAVLAQHITQPPRPPREINPAVSEELDAVVLKMLAKDPDERFQSLEAFVEALDGLKKG